MHSWDGSANAIFIMLSYTIQIYFDFSGYCDMATGIAKMFNIDLPMNFDSPYKSFTVTEFWKKWHMTLTRFLRTYVYFPLGGNRKGKIRTYINLFIVFFVSGIWHGANYTFIVWGAMHGLFMVYERIFRNRIKHMHPALSWLITFIFINFSWVVFRADCLGDAIFIIKQVLLFDFNPLSSEIMNSMDCVGLVYLCNHLGHLGMYFLKILPMFLLIVVFFIVLFCDNTNQRINKFKPTISNAIISGILLFYSIISLSGISTFLYFNF